MELKEYNHDTRQFSKSLGDKFSYAPKTPLRSKGQDIAPNSDISTSKFLENSPNCMSKENDPNEFSYLDYDSDVDKYMENVEEKDIYSMSPVLEGEIVGDYDAFSPLDSEEQSCAMIPEQCATEPSCYNKILSVAHKITCDDISKPTVQQKYAFAGRKRLIDEILDLDDAQLDDDMYNSCSRLDSKKSNSVVGCFKSSPLNITHYLTKEKESNPISPPVKKKGIVLKYRNTNTEINKNNSNAVITILSPEVVKHSESLLNSSSACGRNDATSTRCNNGNIADTGKRSNQSFNGIQQSLQVPTPCSFFTAPKRKPR